MQARGNSRPSKPQSRIGMPRTNQSNEPNLEDAISHLARMFCQESISPRSLCDEHDPFRQLLQTLNPNLKLDFKTLERHCLKIYGEERERVKEIFSKLEGRISLSFDVPVYIGSYSMAECMCLAAHFIDNDWKLQRWVIKYCEQTWDQHPATVSFESLKEFGIESKVLALTVGGTRDADLSEEAIQESWEVPMKDHKFHWQISCSDIISKMMQEGFEEIRDIIGKVELLAWSKSLPVWYLTSFKLREALELEALGEFSSESVRQDYDLPSEQEWAKVKSICRIADKIYDIVKGLFEVKRLTANLFLPHLQEIRAFLIQESSSADEFVKALAQKMFKTFDEYWENVYVVLAIAAFMDPRYKMKFIEFSFSKHEGECGYSKAASVMEVIRKLYDGYLVKSHQKEYLLVDSSSESEDEEDEEEGPHSHKQAKKECSNLTDTLSILSSYCQAVQSTNGDQSAKTDLDLYLEEPVLPWTENFDVLLWWKDNCSKYPHVSKMARDFLAIPFSVASDYEAYYIEPRQPDSTVQGLKPTFMNALMCTRSWKLDHKKH